MAEKTDRFIVTPKPVDILVYHDVSKLKQAAISSSIFMDSSLVSEADITVLVNEVRETPLGLDHLELHRHDASEVYVILRGRTIEVTLEDEKHEVTGPAAVFIPAGMRHGGRLVRGSGYSLAILRRGKYE